MKGKTKRVVIMFFCVLIVVFIGLTAASMYFYKVGIKRTQKEFLRSDKALEGNFKPEADGDNELKGAAWVDSVNYETWTLTSEDNLNLLGYYIPAKTASDKTVILAHGYNSCGKDMGTFAKFYYLELGYNVLMPDARGHGNSEGDYIGFGWHDRKDYLLWIKKVIDKVGDNSEILLHGISMGGATVMMTSGEALPEQVKLIIEDCGYTSVADELAYQLKRMYNLPSFPLLLTTSLYTDIKVGYNFYEASSVKQVKKNKLPMLFIHGGNDTYVPTEMVYEVYEACSAEKDILIIDNAAHGLAYTTDQEAYEAKLQEFIDRYLK